MSDNLAVATATIAVLLGAAGIAAVVRYDEYIRNRARPADASFRTIAADPDFYRALPDGVRVSTEGAFPAGPNELAVTNPPVVLVFPGPVPQPVPKFVCGRVAGRRADGAVEVRDCRPCDSR